ncbi:MAG: hypothetical protein EAX96_13175 [Candidatus Lokiarchaeota archaeon]|nr:hypothetical protein [Candidatus Lokiarchaeota archaeon]
MENIIKEKLKKFILFSKNIENLSEIENLPITRIKGMTKNLAEILKKTHKISKIEDLSTLELDNNDIRVLESQGIKRLNIINWIILSKVIKSSELENYFGPKKIVLVGLHNAGKTALMQLFKKDFDINTFGKILPTKGVDRVSISSENHEYIIWDMGGQTNYRQKYLKDAEKFFLNIELMIFVIDVQDKSNFNSAILYLKDIISSLEFLQENPNISILIHKVDPDIKDKEEILENIKFLKKKIHEVFKEKQFTYELSTSSIFQTLSKDPQVAKEIKSTITSEHKVSESIQDIKLGTTIENTLNLMVNLSASIEERLSNIENTMQYAVEWIEYIKQALPIKSPQTFKEEDEEDKIIGKTLSIRQAINNELKSILKMRRIEQ